MSELDALKAAEAALEQAQAALVAAEHATPVAGSDSGAPMHSYPGDEGSVYLGHVGEPAVKGKDF